MDKYQEYLFGKLNISSQSEPTNREREFSFRDGKITIRQNDDYHITKYNIRVFHPALDEIWTLYKDKKQVGKKVNKTKEDVKILTLDFNRKASSLFISFKNNLANPIEIPIDYIDADKSAWDAKMDKEHKEHLASIVNIKIISGDSLIDVLYNPLNDKYSYCEITLYYAYTKQGEKTKSYQLMGNFQSEKGKFYIPIINLGYSSYAIDLKQYDENKELIYESDRIEFSLSRQSTSVYNGRPIVHLA